MSYPVLVRVMGLVDDIRRYVFQYYIKPAVDRGWDSITLRAGNIHREMHLYSRMPTVCTALGSSKSIEVFNMWLRELGYSVRVRLSSVNTPPSGYGANSYYTYSFIKEPDEREGLIPAPSPDAQDSFLNRRIHGRQEYEEITEDLARSIMSDYLGIQLYKERLNINGKFKEFDLVNVEHRVVGDFKCFKYKGPAMAEMSNMIEYIWIMEKLEKYTGARWRKIIVGAGNRKTFETFVRRYNPWLEDVEVYYITQNHKIVKLR